MQLDVLELVEQVRRWHGCRAVPQCIENASQLSNLGLDNRPFIRTERFLTLSFEPFIP